MKNEDRIVELLAESLQRLDRMVERQDRHEDIIIEQTKILREHTDIIKEQTKALNRLNESVGELRTDFRELGQLLKSELLGRIERLEQAVFRQGA